MTIQYIKSGERMFIAGTNISVSGHNVRAVDEFTHIIFKDGRIILSNVLIYIMVLHFVKNIMIRLRAKKIIILECF